MHTITLHLIATTFDIDDSKVASLAGLAALLGVVFRLGAVGLDWVMRSRYGVRASKQSESNGDGGLGKCPTCGEEDCAFSPAVERRIIRKIESVNERTLEAIGKLKDGYR